MVVIAADHGEALGEHDYYFDHGDLLYEEQLRVPFVVKGPGVPRDGRRIPTPVSLVDVMPTVIELCGFDRVAGLDGRSLVSVMWLGEGADDTGVAVFAESDKGDFMRPQNRSLKPGVEGKLRSVRKGRHKLIYFPRPSGDILELYDLEADPGETQNLRDARPELLRILSKELFEWIGSEGTQSRAKIVDPAAQARLRALGYLP